MSWVYHQKTGKLYHDGTLIGSGWAGNGVGKNAPAMQNMPSTGPFPVASTLWASLSIT